MSDRNKINGFDIDDPRFRIRPYQQIASSVTGALITSLLMTPLDVVKTRLQVQQKIQLSNKCYLYCNGLMDHLCPCGPNGAEKAVVRFNGTIDALVKISKAEGVRSLWSGLSPTLVLALPTTVLYFVAYEQFRLALKEYRLNNLSSFSDQDPESLPVWIPLVAGLSARIFAVTIVNPLELIRTKMQSEKMSYTEVGRGFKAMIKVNGVNGLFKGLFPTILRDAPFSGIYWTTYETYKKYNNITHPSFGSSFIGGALAGSIAAFVTVPFDVVKTHQQIEFGEKIMYAKAAAGNGRSRSKSTGTFGTIHNIWRNSGVTGFYAGLTPRLFKVTPACAIMISSFEYGKTFFHKYNVNKYYDYEQKNGTSLISVSVTNQS